MGFKEVVTGTDIHVFAEYKINDGEWFCDPIHAIYNLEEVKNNPKMFPEFNELSSNRDYKLFGALANVRGDGPEPKGWPKDTSETLRLIGQPENSEFFNSRFHSHSWYSLKEFKQILRKRGIKLLPKKATVEKKDIIFNWKESYPASVKYIETQIKKYLLDLEVEKLLLNSKEPYKVECRVLFCFDS